jgi:hypothetical protein
MAGLKKRELGELLPRIAGKAKVAAAWMEKQADVYRSGGPTTCMW